MIRKIHLVAARIAAGATSTGRARTKLALAGIVIALGAVAAAAQAQLGTQSVLVAVSGQGTGYVLVSPTAQDKPTFAAEVEVNVQGTLPNSTFTVERRLDLNPDGVCTGTTWVPAGPITTSEGGAGALHFFVERGAPFVSGTRFDVQLHVIGNGIELQSDCITVTVK
jgi:hypothetical protein